MVFCIFSLQPSGHILVLIHISLIMNQSVECIFPHVYQMYNFIYSYEMCAASFVFFYWVVFFSYWSVRVLYIFGIWVLGGICVSVTISSHSKLLFRSLSSIFWTHVLDFYFGWYIGKSVWLTQLLRHWGLRIVESHSSFEHFHIHGWGGNGFSQLYWGIIVKYLKCRTWWFEIYMYMYCERIPQLSELAQMFLILIQTNITFFLFWLMCFFWSSWRNLCYKISF